MDGSILAQFQVSRYEVARAVVELPDNTVLVGSDIGLKRYSADGQMIAQLLSGYQADHLLHVRDDSVLVGSERSSSNRFLLLINSTGKVDSAVNANAEVFALARQPDGKILVGGRFTIVNGKARPYLARLMPDCSVDETFRPPPLISENPTITQLAVQADGSIIAGGFFSYIGETKRTLLARFTKDGELDANYDPGSLMMPVRPGEPMSIDWMRDYADNIHIRGYFVPPGGTIREIARIDQNGMVSSGTLTNSGLLTSEAAIQMQPDGKFLIAGPFGYINGGKVYQTLIRLLRDGSYDPSFSIQTFPTVLRCL
jgi:uncharacterized delta-60 repeat protein